MHGAARFTEEPPLTAGSSPFAGKVLEASFLWLCIRTGPAVLQARAMCASYPYQHSSESVAELIASDTGEPEYLV